MKQSSKLGLKGNVPRFGFVSYEKPQRQTMLMLWDGNRQIQELTDSFIFTTVYEQDSFVPVARIVQLSAELEKRRITEKIRYIEQHVPYGIVNQEFYDNIKKAKEPLVKIYYYHCNHLGTPQELSDDKGDVIWLSYDRAWGGSFDSLYKQQFVDNFAISENELQPFKFQGQFFDGETNLHYNRFRYYDSDVGMFISRDPIGLLGGSNVFSYAPNPIGWVDPFGLARSTRRNSRRNTASTSQVAEKVACNIISNPKKPNEITVYHFTDKAGFNAITSGKDITIKAGKPLARGNPKAVYVTKYSPQQLGKNIAEDLTISADKTKYVIAFNIDASKVKQVGNNLKKSYILDDVKLTDGSWRAGEVVAGSERMSKDVNWCKGKN